MQFISLSLLFTNSVSLSTFQHFCLKHFKIEAETKDAKKGRNFQKTWLHRKLCHLSSNAISHSLVTSLPLQETQSTRQETCGQNNQMIMKHQNSKKSKDQHNIDFAATILYIF